MLLKDVDGRLDTECQFTFSREDRVFSISKTMNRSFICFLDPKENVLTAYIPDSEEEYEDIGLPIAKEEREGFTVVELAVEDTITRLIKSIASIPTAAIPTISVENGKLTARFRLHNTFLPQVSNALAKITTLKSLLSDVSIFQSRGLTFFLHTINEESPLQVVILELPLALMEDSAVVSALKKGGVAELSYFGTDPSRPRFIVYGNGGDEPGLVPVVQDSFIFETSINSETLKALTSILNSERIKRYGVFFKIDDDKLKRVIFLNRYDAVRGIAEALEFYRRSGYPAALTLSQKFSEDIWKFV